MTQDRRGIIEDLLRSGLDPDEVLVKDQSHLHAGHAGAREGKGHFEVIVVSKRFEGLGRIARHRLVYDALGEFMHSDIHALSIQAFTPSERS